MTVLAFLCFTAVNIFVTCYFFPSIFKGLAVCNSVYRFAYNHTLCIFQKNKQSYGFCFNRCFVGYVHNRCICFTNLLNFGQLTTIEDVSYYERTLSRTTVDKCCEGLLPRHMPKDAENVVFFYTPKFMQGSEEFILAFKADDSTLSSYETKLKENAIRSGTYNQSIADNKNILLFLSFY